MCSGSGSGSGTTYAESVASCAAPLCSPSREAHPRLHVRRHLDFPGADDDDEDFLYRAAELMERSLYHSQRPVAGGLTAVPPFPDKQCICGRGPCNVVWQLPGHWAYVCSAPPKCKHSARCEESDPHPNSQPALWSHLEPNDHPMVNAPNNHWDTMTRVNVSPHGVSPQSADATAPVNFNAQGAAAAASPVNISSVGRSNGKWPTCKCTAGKCKISKVKGVEYYVCPIQKGQGACSHRELVNADAEEQPQTRNNNPMNVTQGCMMLHQPVAALGLETPRKSPLTSKFTISPTTPRSGSCFHCGVAGHWKTACPQLHNKRWV